jgi:hypothetical protein
MMVVVSCKISMINPEAVFPKLPAKFGLNIPIILID